MWRFPSGVESHPPRLIPFVGAPPLPMLIHPPYHQTGEENGLLPTPTWPISPYQSSSNQQPALFNQIHPSIYHLIKFPSPFLPPGAQNPYKQDQAPRTNSNISNDIQPFSDLFQLLLKEKSLDADKHPYLRLFQALPLNDQLTCFIRSQLMTSEQLRIRWQLAFDIQCILRFTYPQCQVYVFGSLLTGLGDSDSDVDIYVDWLGDDGLFFCKSPSPITAIRQARDWIKLVLVQSRSLHTLDPLAIDIKSIGKNVPYIRFTHYLTNLSCDLSVGNRIPVQNSKLLLFYLTYDPRVEPLVRFLRYWGKYHGVVGDADIKPYAFSLLVVVYLTKKKVLPSIHLLQTLEAENRRAKGIMGNPDEIEDCDTSFCEDINLINDRFVDRFDCTSQKYSLNSGRILLEMALGFFDMFANVDYSKMIICPLIGDVVDKSIVETSKEMSLIFKKEWPINELAKPLCIQDPFVLTFNVGRFVKSETVGKFQNACEQTFKALWPKREEVSCLLTLFVPMSSDDDEINKSNNVFK